MSPEQPQIAMNHTKDNRVSRGLIWMFVAAVPVMLIMAADVCWSHHHPYGYCWDEAAYINDSLIDSQRLEHGLLLKLGGRLLIRCSGRPPAYRLFALPFVVVFGSHTASMRFLSVVCFGLSAWLVYMATRRIASARASALATCLFAVSPEVVSASMWFTTEGPLYLAVSGMLYFLFVLWTDATEERRNWIGLGLAVGLGFLSKVSFLAIALPALVFTLVMHRRGFMRFPSLSSLLKAGLLAFLVAGPWWLLNIKSITGSVGEARGFAAHSLGPRSPATWLMWLDTVFQGLLGHGVGIMILLVLGIWLWEMVRKKAPGMNDFEKAALGVCACAGVPILLAQLSGTNHLLRHVSPAMVPLAIGIAILFDKIQWFHSKAVLVACGVLLAAQLLMIVAPVVFPNDRPVPGGFVNTRLPWRVMTRRDQWDWSPLMGLADNLGLKAPKISYMGLGPGLSMPQLEYPWALREAAARGPAIAWPQVTWLWRFDRGPVDWQGVLNAAGESDIVLTLPHYTGVETEDRLHSQHNDELVERLSQDARFQKPIALRVGRFAPVEVLIFVRKTSSDDPMRDVPETSQPPGKKS